MFALSSRLPSNYPPFILTYYHETPPLSRQQASCTCRPLSRLTSPPPSALRPQGPGSSWNRAPLHKAASLPQTPRLNESLGKSRAKEGTSNVLLCCLGLHPPQNIRCGFGVERMWNPLRVAGGEKFVRLCYRDVVVQ